MKRKAFTLVELLVVVAIIVLLVAILAPGFRDAVARGRAATCQNNLHNISTAFANHYAQQQLVEGKAQTADYPSADQWPSIPWNVCQSRETFHCPEAEGTAAGAGLPLSEYLSQFLYTCRNRGFSVPFGDPAHQGVGKMNLGTRTGSDQTGNYIEIGLDDNSVVTANYMDNDGHDGLMRIYAGAGGRRFIKLLVYYCGEKNCVTHYDNPVFTGPGDTPGVTDPGSIEYGWLGPATYNSNDRSEKEGMEVDLESMICTYGINWGSENLSFGARKILVTDYDENIVDSTDPNIQTKLQAAARHLGKLNILFTDSTVKAFGPTEIDPLLPGNATLWQP